MQTVSSAFLASSTGSLSKINYGVLISFAKTLNTSVHFWTIGTSTIGGPDMILGANGIPAFMDIFQYIDYSDYATAWTVTRDLGQYPYGIVGAQATVQLDNTSLLFLPNFDATIGSYITLGRPIKISAGFGTESINVFTGYTTMPINDVQNRLFSTNAYDMMDYLNNYKSTTTPIQVNVYADAIIASLLAEVGLTSSQYVLEQSLQQPIGFYSPYNLKIGDIIQALCEAEQALFFFDENGIAHFWNRQHIPNNNTVQYSFDETTMTNVQPADSPVINDVIVTANPRSVQAKQKVWEMTSATLVPPSPSSTTFTNLIANPSFESNITGWTGVSTTLSQSTAQFYVGISSLSMVGLATFVPKATTPITYTTGQSYTARAYVKGTAGQTAQLYETAGGASSAALTLSGAWDLITWTFTPSVASSTLGVKGNTAAATLYVDAVILQTVNILATYFDGGTNYTNTNVFNWNGTPGASTSTSIPVGSVVISADFQDSDGALPVTSVDDPVYYTASTSAHASNFTANFNTDGTGPDAGGYLYISGASLTNIASSATQLNGSNYQITFLNTSTIPIYVTQFALYGTPAKVTYIINTEYSDAASIKLYGTNPANSGQAITIQNDLIQSPSTANSNAHQLVTDFAQPYQRLTADVFPAMQLQIGDEVAVNIQDASQLLNYTIVSIAMGADGDNLITQTLGLEVKVLTIYFQINVSQIGSTDQIAP
jgi:hypothetical protein